MLKGDFSKKNPLKLLKVNFGKIVFRVKLRFSTF